MLRIGVLNVKNGVRRTPMLSPRAGRGENKRFRPRPAFFAGEPSNRSFSNVPPTNAGLFLCFPSPPTQREAERRQTWGTTSAPAGCGAAPIRWDGREQPACRRPTAALAEGTYVTQGATQAMFPGTRSGRCYRPSPVPVQRAPRAPVVMPADMIPKPPGNGPYLPARGHRTRSRLPEYLRERRPLSERAYAR